MKGLWMLAAALLVLGEFSLSFVGLSPLPRAFVSGHVLEWKLAFAFLIAAAGAYTVSREPSIEPKTRWHVLTAFVVVTASVLVWVDNVDAEQTQQRKTDVSNFLRSGHNDPNGKSTFVATGDVVAFPCQITSWSRVPYESEFRGTMTCSEPAARMRLYVTPDSPRSRMAHLRISAEN
jgi:hypothetical protein